MAYLIVPETDVSDGAPTTLTNAVLDVDGTLTGLTNGTTYRAYLLSSVTISPAITPLGDVLERMATTRVDFVGIGDSNQLFGGTGWDHGLQSGLDAQGYALWATGLVSQNENNGFGGGVGYLYNRFGKIGETTGAPAELAKFVSKGSGDFGPIDYTYLGTGSYSAGNAPGLIVSGASALDTSAALEFDLHYGTFDSGSGSFQTGARINASPFTNITRGSVTSTNTGAFGMGKTTLEVPADAGRSGINVIAGPAMSGGENIEAPFFMTYARWRRPDRTAGYAFSTLYGSGGQSLRDMAFALQEASDETLQHFFSILRDDQGDQRKTIVICINSGLNDRQETLASVGPDEVADADSADAYVDNLKAIQARISGIWTSNGWSLDELFFLIFPSHPIDDPDDAELVAYRSAATTYAATQDRMQVIDLAALTNEAEMLAAGWYNGGGSDRSHLTEVGYEALGQRVIANITVGP